MTAVDEPVPIVDGPSTQRVSWPLLVLVRKELVEHVHGYRFHIGVLICVTLCGLAAWVRIADFKLAYHERQQFLQRWFPAVEEQLERDENVQIENTRAVSPLSVFSVGLEPTIPFRFSSTKEGLRYGETRAARNSVDALFGYVDLTFVVTVLMSLLAIAVTFDSICGERADGTLALLLSYPVSRGTVLTAKTIAAMAVVLACALPAFVLVLLAMKGAGLPLMSGGHVALYGLAVVLYVAVFVVIGIVVSLRVRRRPDAALAAILVWVILVFAAPRMVSLFVNGFRSPARAVELALRQDEIESRLKLDASRLKKKAFERYVAESDSAHATDALAKFRKDADSIAADLQQRRSAELQKIWDEVDRDEKLRQRYVAAFSVVSPTALFNNVAAELAWTGYVQRDHFYRESRAYDENFGRKLAESHEIYFAHGAGQDVGRALVTRRNVRPYMSPYQPTWAPSALIVKSILPPLVVLAVAAALLYLVARALFVRLDVRVG